MRIPIAVPTAIPVLASEGELGIADNVDVGKRLLVVADEVSCKLELLVVGCG